MQVDRILQETGAEKVIIVGHSMGGVVARHYALYHAGSEKLAKIVAVGSPHHGTILASGVRLEIIGSFCTCIRQMAPNSDFLTELNEIEEEDGTTPITSIFTYDDQVVVPQESSFLEVPHAKTIACGGMGHLSMPFTHSINMLILQELLDVGYDMHP